MEVKTGLPVGRWFAFSSWNRDPKASLTKTAERLSWLRTKFAKNLGTALSKAFSATPWRLVPGCQARTGNTKLLGAIKEGWLPESQKTG